MEKSLTLPDNLALLKEMVLDYKSKLSEKNTALKESRDALKRERDAVKKERLEHIALKKAFQDQEKELLRQHEKINQLRQRVQFLLHQRYGKKSEKLSSQQ